MKTADQQILKKLDEIKAAQGGGGGGVSAVSGAAPIASSGGSTPEISIAPATTSDPGSMSAADKTKIDGLGHSITVYAAGTAYVLTATPTALDFGTTDPVLTINQAGTYIIRARVVVATPTTSGIPTGLGTLIFKLRRTNNTAADLTNSTTTFAWSEPTASGFPVNQVITLPEVIYNTVETTDSLTIFGTNDSGTVDVTEASIVAIRIQ